MPLIPLHQALYNHTKVTFSRQTPWQETRGISGRDCRLSCRTELGGLVVVVHSGFPPAEEAQRPLLLSS